MIFSVNAMSCGYHGTAVLTDISFSVENGEILCILGPNGVGKTTLFKSMLGLLPPLSGTVTVDAEDISCWSNRRRARTIAYIPQSHTPPFPYTVRQVVTMGRVAQLGMFASPTKADYEIADRMLDRLGIAFLADRTYTEISGGERQMALIARALTQKPQILLMDEPTANLDFGNQARVLGVIRSLANQGLTVVMTTHSPDHAFLCSSKVILLERGNRYSFGNASELVTEESLGRAYGIDVCVLEGTHGTRSVKGCVPLIDAETTVSATYTLGERNHQ